MKQFKACFFVFALLAWGPAYALPADHPANPEAAVPAFQPADYFASQPGSIKLAADEHQHDAAPAAQESGAKDKAAARDEGMGCCKCCCMGGSEKGGMGCMNKSGDTGMKGSGMMDCDMMKMMNKKGMRQDGDKPATEPAEQPETKKEEGHESHH